MLNQNEKIYWKLYNDVKNATYHGVIYTSHSHSVIYSFDILWPFIGCLHTVQRDLDFCLLFNLTIFSAIIREVTKSDKILE